MKTHPNYITPWVGGFSYFSCFKMLLFNPPFRSVFQVFTVLHSVAFLAGVTRTSFAQQTRTFQQAMAGFEISVDQRPGDFVHKRNTFCCRHRQMPTIWVASFF